MAKSSTKKTDSFEHSLRRLEQIVESLEQGSIPLEDALKIYEEGVVLSKQCLEKLTQAELKLKRLSKDVDGKFELLDEDAGE